jgi:hypothetical protein
MAQAWNRGTDVFLYVVYPGALDVLDLILIGIYRMRTDIERATRWCELAMSMNMYLPDGARNQERVSRIISLN